MLASIMNAPAINFQPEVSSDLDKIKIFILSKVKYKFRFVKKWNQSSTMVVPHSFPTSKISIPLLSIFTALVLPEFHTFKFYNF